MNTKTFELALDRTAPSDWEHFERLSSQFLASEFPNLRTMASASGDGGRDSELFAPENAASVAVQYSVTKNWERKISQTLDRLSDGFPGVRVLIYMSSHKIGAAGDNAKKKSIERGVSLDIRDSNWFLERMNLDDTKAISAKEYSNAIALPYLEGQRIIESNSPSLSNVEAKAALTYLAMQWEDENTDKGLTKVVYESLVLAALRSTNSEKRITRQEIVGAIRGYLSSAEDSEFLKQIESALTRLEKKKIRYWKQQNEYCLTHDEYVRQSERLIQTHLERERFNQDIESILRIEIDNGARVPEEHFKEYSERVVRVLDSFLISSGEAFASSLVAKEVRPVDKNLLTNAIFSDISSHPSKIIDLSKFPDIALNVIARVVSSSRPSIRQHLKKVSDSYTLFSFLRETPDVQKATKKIFGHGKIWLDTTIVLPLLVESMYAEDMEKKFTFAVSSMRKAGVDLRITHGVAEEVVSHIRKSYNCSRFRPSEWIGRVPYLYLNYIEQGYSPHKFSEFAVHFRGEERPVDDICDYLENVHGIKTEDLGEHASLVDSSLRFTTERLWKEAHENRRRSGTDETETDVTTDILVRHDVENYLGIIGLRTKESASELGFKHWWLTTDSVAWRIRNQISAEMKVRPPSPLMSLDFLLNWLSFGPARSRLERTSEQLLPVLLESDFSEHMPRDLLEVAERVRSENEGAPEYLIRRKIRDACDQMKGKFGKAMRAAVGAEQFAAGRRP